MKGGATVKAKIGFVLYKIQSGFWFVPTIITLLAIALSQLALFGDQMVSDGALKKVGGIIRIGPEGARLLISTIAGSMMTVTSLVFSLTLVALTMTSSQFGPRLLTNFMRDRVTQVVLGVFLATFVYALITLGSIEKADEADIVPHLSITGAMVMALGSFGMLIYFIHHIATSIQADAIIAKMARELYKGIDAQFPEAGSAEQRGKAESKIPADDVIAANAAVVRSDESGYIQSIDYESLVETAARHDLVIKLGRRAGHFIVAGEPVALLHPAHNATAEAVEATAAAMVVGQTPTMVQDLEFAVNAITEVAMRALSPGINDTHTALSCIDYLSAGLAKALTRDIPPAALSDADGNPRIVTQRYTFEGLMDSAFDEIRQSAPSNVAVILRLLEALTRIAPFATDPARRSAIRKHAEMLERAYQENVEEPNDRSDIDRRFEDLKAVLADA